jgi:hypothetical protein
VKKVVGTITYEGGEVVPFVAGPQAFAALEAYARRQDFDVTAGRDNATVTLYLAYAALHVQEGFDVWLGSVDDVDTGSGDADGIEVPPTPEAARPG